MFPTTPSTKSIYKSVVTPFTGKTKSIAKMSLDEKVALAASLASGNADAKRIVAKHIVAGGGADAALHDFLSMQEVQQKLLPGLMTGQLADLDVIRCISRVTVSLTCQESTEIWNANFPKLLEILPTQPSAINALYLLNGDIPLEHQLPLAEIFSNWPFKNNDDVTRGLIANRKKFTDINAQSSITWKLKKVSDMSLEEKRAFMLALASDNVNAMTVIYYHINGIHTDPVLYDFFSENQVQQVLFEALMKGTLTNSDVIPYIYRVCVSLSKEESLKIWHANFETLLKTLPKHPCAINALYLLNTEIPVEHQYYLAKALFGSPFQHETFAEIAASGLAFNVPKFTENDAKSLLSCGFMECVSINYCRQMMHLFLPIWYATDSDVEAKWPLEFPKKIENLSPNCARLNGFRLLLIARVVKYNEFKGASHLKILQQALKKGDLLTDKEGNKKALEDINRLSTDRTSGVEKERLNSQLGLRGHSTVLLQRYSVLLTPEQKVVDHLDHLPSEQRSLVSPLPKKTLKEFDPACIEEEAETVVALKLLQNFDDAGQTSFFSSSTLIGIGMAASVTALAVYAGYKWYNQTQENGQGPDL